MVTLADKEHILIVDDDPNMRELLRRHLGARGYNVVAPPEAGEAARVLAAQPIDLVISALPKSKGSAADFIKHLRKNYTHTEVIIVTGYAALREAVRAAKAGAAEYLIKPFTEEELCTVVQNALSKLSVRQATAAPDYPAPSAAATSARHRA